VSEKKNRTFRLDETIRNRLVLAAELTHRTPTSYLERAIEQQIKRDIETGELPTEKQES
jgi:predicted transcriptional regulator